MDIKEQEGSVWNRVKVRPILTRKKILGKGRSRISVASGTTKGRFLRRG